MMPTGRNGLPSQSLLGCDVASGDHRDIFRVASTFFEIEKPSRVLGRINGLVVLCEVFRQGGLAGRFRTEYANPFYKMRAHAIRQVFPVFVWIFAYLFSGDWNQDSGMVNRNVFGA